MRRLGLLVATCLALASLTGCAGAHPVDSRALAIAVGVDPNTGPGVSKGDRFVWHFVFPNPTATASNVSSMAPSTETYQVTVRAPDLAAAVERVQDRLSREPYLGDLENLVLNLGIDAQDARSIVSDLNQDGMIPTSFLVIATPAPTDKLLGLPTRQESIPRYYLSSYFSCSWCHSFNWREPAWDWWARSVSPGVAPVAPILVPAKSHMVADGVAVYGKGGPALRMTTDEAIGLAYIAGRVTRDNMSAATPDGQPLTVVRMTAKSRWHAQLEGDHVVADIHIRVRGTTASGMATDSAPIDQQVRQLVSQHVLAHAQAAIAWSNAMHVDPVGFDRAALLTRPAQAYRLPSGAHAWLPVDARITVSTTTGTAGTSR